MKELSLNILDIAQNSIKAGAQHLEIELDQRGTVLTITITDDGRGMSPEFAAAAADPFTTTRTTRKVGMGLPLFKMAAEQTGGTFWSRNSRTNPTQSMGHASARRFIPRTWTVRRSAMLLPRSRL
jgi:signal transduction histidine kinase